MLRSVVLLLFLGGCAQIVDLLGIGEFDAKTLLESKTFICPGKSAGEIIQQYGEPQLFAAYQVICGEKE